MKEWFLEQGFVLKKACSIKDLFKSRARRATHQTISKENNVRLSFVDFVDVDCGARSVWQRTDAVALASREGVAQAHGAGAHARVAGLDAAAQRNARRWVNSLCIYT